MPSHDYSDLTDNPLVSWAVTRGELAKRAFGLVYLATPYSLRAAPAGVFDWDRADDAALEAAQIVGDLARLRITALSPVALSHVAVAADYEAGGDLHARALDADFWSRWCAPMLAACRFVYVPNIPGWRDSAGIAHEIRAALRDCKSVLFGAGQ